MKRARWPWLLGIACTVAAVAAVGAGTHVVSRVVQRVAPGDELVLDIDAAHPYDPISRDEAVRRTVEALRSRVDKLSLGRVTVDGTRATVLVPGVGRRAPLEVIERQLLRSGRLEFRVVDDGSDYMRGIAAALDRAPITRVHVDHDQWSGIGDGKPHDDPYLDSGDDEILRDAWQRLVAAAPLPAGRALAYEEITDADGAPRWRSYLVTARPALTGDAVTEAEAVWDADSGRPEVSVTFDSDGARRLAEVTAGAVGKKLAILLEGRVTSAPVIESKIEGGHARITMGGGKDPGALTSETRDLVAVLRSGGLAAPVRLVSVRRK